MSNQYFKAQNAGYSAAVGIFTFLFIMVVSNIFTNYSVKGGGYVMEKDTAEGLVEISGLGVAIIIFHVLPIYVLVVMAFKSMSDSSSLLSLPEKVYTANFVKVFQSGNIPSALRNTIIVTVCVLLIEIVVGGLASYPLPEIKANGTGL